MIKLDSTELWEILFGIDEWAAGQISDKTLQKLAEALNQIPDDTAPITKHDPAKTRVDTGIYLSWAEANPELLVKTIGGFQKEYSIQDWKHFVDMALPGHFSLIAVRRTKPYDRNLDFLPEIGM